MSNIETVKSIYESFDRGDIPAILNHLDEAIEWEYGTIQNDVPWLRHRKGRAEVPAFFESLSAAEIHKFDVKHIFEGQDLVVALIDLESTVKSTGTRIIETDGGHIWHFNNEGKVIKFRHLLDTHQHVKAYTGEV